jgi:hypothetical protein
LAEKAFWSGYSWLIRPGLDYLAILRSQLHREQLDGQNPCLATRVDKTLDKNSHLKK